MNPAFEGKPFAGRRHVLCVPANDVNMTGVGYLTMVRAETHKLVKFRGSEEGQVFDLRTDPGELRISWHDLVCADAMRDLLDAMLEFHLESIVRTRNACRLFIAPPGGKYLK